MILLPGDPLLREKRGPFLSGTHKEKRKVLINNFFCFFCLGDVGLGGRGRPGGTRRRKAPRTAQEKKEREASVQLKFDRKAELAY